MLNINQLLKNRLGLIFLFKDKKRYDYWKRMEFTSEEWQGPLIMQEKEDCCLCLQFFQIKPLE